MVFELEIKVMIYEDVAAKVIEYDEFRMSGFPTASESCVKDDPLTLMSITWIDSLFKFISYLLKFTK